MAYTEHDPEPETMTELEPTAAELRYMGFLAGHAGRLPAILNDKSSQDIYDLGYVAGVRAAAQEKRPAVSTVTGRPGQDPRTQPAAR